MEAKNEKGIEEEKIDVSHYVSFLEKCFAHFPLLRWITENAPTTKIYGSFVRWCTEKYFDDRQNLPDFSLFDSDIDLFLSHRNSDILKQLFDFVFSRNGIVEYAGNSYAISEERDLTEFDLDGETCRYLIWVDGSRFDVFVSYKHPDQLVRNFDFNVNRLSFRLGSVVIQPFRGSRVKNNIQIASSLLDVVMDIRKRRLSFNEHNLTWHIYYRVLKLIQKGYRMSFRKWQSFISLFLTCDHQSIYGTSFHVASSSLQNPSTSYCGKVVKTQHTYRTLELKDVFDNIKAAMNIVIDDEFRSCN